jgi:hypothetical protein
VETILAPRFFPSGLGLLTDTEFRNGIPSDIYVNQTNLIRMYYKDVKGLLH